MTDFDGFDKGAAVKIGEWKESGQILEVKLTVLAVGLDVGGGREILHSSQRLGFGKRVNSNNVYQMEKTKEGKDLGGWKRNRYFCSGYAWFEMPFGHSNGDIRQAIDL